MAQAAVVAAMAAMSLVQGISQKSGLDKQAGALDENARLTETQGAYDAVDSLRKSRLQEGVDITGAAASGSGLTGSVADMLESNAVERQLEAMNIRYAAGQRAQGLRTEAEQKRSEGRSALLGGVLRAGASAIQGYSGASNSAAIGGALSRDSAQRLGGVQAMGTIPVPMGAR
jgi:hypothetical protein